MKFGRNSKFIKKMVSFAALGSTALLLSLPTSAQTPTVPGSEAQTPGGSLEVPGTRPAPRPTAPTAPTPSSPTTPTRPTAPVNPGTPSIPPQTLPQRPTQPGPTSPTTPRATTGTVVDIAANNTSFRTLTRALEAAGLTETLRGQGPFTIFAPTDEAFAALPSGALEELLKPENRQQLIKVLTYHVVPGRLASSSLQSGNVTTVEGSPIAVQVAEGKVRVNNANVVGADIPASNGIIHVIDRVILPPAQ